MPFVGDIVGGVFPADNTNPASVIPNPMPDAQRHHDTLGREVVVRASHGLPIDRMVTVAGRVAEESL